MHYRNGRAANNGDKIVKLEGGKIVSYGVLHSAVAGNDYCNGNIAIVQAPNDYACMVDCLHVEDVAALLATNGLDKRPEGKLNETLGERISRANKIEKGQRHRREDLLTPDGLPYPPLGYKYPPLQNMPEFTCVDQNILTPIR